MESRRLSLRVEKLERFLRFLNAAATEIRYSAMPVEKILRKHGSGLDFLAQCAQACSGGMDCSAQWRRAVDEKARSEGFAKGDMDLLRGFGEGFGTTDTDGQISHFRLYADLTASRLENAKEERGRKSKLYLMLGIFAGVTAALLLC